MTMQAEYTITEDDYVSAQRLGIRSWRSRLIYFGGGLAAGLLFFSYSRIPVQELAILLAIGLAGGVLLSRFLVPVLGRRHYRQYKLLHLPITLRHQDDGLHFSSAAGSLVLTWDKILKWRDNRDYILVFQAPRLFHIVPKSIQADGFDIPGLIDQLTQRVGKPD